MNKLCIAFVLAGGTVFFGCGSSAVPKVDSPNAKTVDVLLDSKPTRSFRVVKELRATAVENPGAIRKMEEQARADGLDGIYWIDCTSSCSGTCTAKGFVYTPLADAPEAVDVSAR